jgi:hypothetical protein
VTAATLRAQWTGLAGRGSSGGDAQERAATNPVAALPCAGTPLPGSLSVPLLVPLLGPPVGDRGGGLTRHRAVPAGHGSRPRRVAV